MEKQEPYARLALRDGMSLFLDFDGTLVELAPTPDAVHVDQGIKHLLARVHNGLHGALANVSGRKLADLDRLLGPLPGVMVAEHGAIIRFDDGRIETLSLDRTPPQAWLKIAEEEMGQWPGILIEPKMFGFAVHYRNAPDLEVVVNALMQSICAESRSHIVLHADMVAEIHPAGVSKAGAIQRLMKEPPFRNGMPIFVGDDPTDLDGMRATVKLGGKGVPVGQSFLKCPADVRRWLTSLVEEGGDAR